MHEPCGLLRLSFREAKRRRGVRTGGRGGGGQGNQDEHEKKEDEVRVDGGAGAPPSLNAAGGDLRCCCPSGFPRIQVPLRFCLCPGLDSQLASPALPTPDASAPVAAAMGDADELLDTLSTLNGDDNDMMLDVEDLAAADAAGAGGPGPRAGPRPPKRPKWGPGPGQTADGVGKPVGIGIIGILIASAESVWGASAQKMMSKCCQVCKNTVGSQDPINPDYTRAWHKPDFAGRICAYCGAARMKLFPHKSTAEVTTDVASNTEVRERFFKWIEAAIQHFLDGNRSLHCMTAPKETLTRTSETGMSSSVKGVFKLLTTYEPILGDPRTNGKGHSLLWKKWKDGVMRPPSLLPQA